MKKILVAVDGSDNSKKALSETKKFAKANNSEVLILSVVSDLKNTYPYMIDWENAAEMNKAFSNEGKKVLEEAEKSFEDYEGKVTKVLKLGDPAKEIINLSKEENVDLVVMGSRGLGTFTRAMLGSVSNKVVNNAPSSVLIIK